jgi:hypothetical protein
MGDKKPASYPVNHDETRRTQQNHIPFHLVYKTLKDSDIAEEKVVEILFRLGSDCGKII